MYFRFLLLLTTLCLSLVRIEAKIIETPNIEEVVPLIDQDTWFLVDLDNCLFEAKQALGHANWWIAGIIDRMEKGMTKEEAVRDFYPEWIKTQKICQVKPVDENTIPILQQLQSKGIVIIGLTHRQPIVADSTFRQVASLGFDFTKTAPTDEIFNLDTALYKQGILFVCDYNNKSDIFSKFMAYIGQKPKKIVFIDDRKSNVRDLEVLTNEGIEYTGVYYTAIYHVKNLYSRELAEFQNKFLDKIMSNEAATLLMESGME